MRTVIALCALTVLTSCNHYPWKLLDTPSIQHASEEGIEQATEASFRAAGKDVHVEVDIDPATDPSCMHCSLHCPTE